MVVPQVMFVRLPNTIPKQWYSGTGMQTRDSCKKCELFRHVMSERHLNSATQHPLIRKSSNIDYFHATIGQTCIHIHVHVVYFATCMSKCKTGYNVSYLLVIAQGASNKVRVVDNVMMSQGRTFRIAGGSLYIAKTTELIQITRKTRHQLCSNVYSQDLPT